MPCGKARLCAEAQSRHVSLRRPQLGFLEGPGPAGTRTRRELQRRRQSGTSPACCILLGAGAQPPRRQSAGGLPAPDGTAAMPRAAAMTPLQDATVQDLQLERGPSASGHRPTLRLALSSQRMQRLTAPLDLTACSQVEAPPPCPSYEPIIRSPPAECPGQPQLLTRRQETL